MGQLLRRPHQVVALAPSSRALCREMAAGVDPDGGPVVELGAGTGTITQAILARGLPPEQLHCIDMNPAFCDRLRLRFPGVHVHQIGADACGTLPVSSAQSVISGLPLLSMPVDLQRDILRGFGCLARPGAELVQFTYGPKPPVAQTVRSELSLVWRRSAWIWGNIPPARVFRFRAADA